MYKAKQKSFLHKLFGATKFCLREIGSKFRNLKTFVCKYSCDLILRVCLLCQRADFQTFYFALPKKRAANLARDNFFAAFILYGCERCRAWLAKRPFRCLGCPPQVVRAIRFAKRVRPGCNRFCRFSARLVRLRRADAG
jgi:hypothetical protein